jgi:hypothetical protein
MKKTILPIIFLAFLSMMNVQAQEEKHDIEKAAQNPIASMYVLPFQNNTQFGVGPFNRTQNVTNVQPVIPVGLGKKVNLIIRTIIPLINQPVGENDSKFGLGDIALSLFFTARKPGKLIWGVGPAIGLATATDPVLGTEKLSAGPAIILLIQPGGWTFGLVAQNTWSFAGNSERTEVNQFFTNPFIVRQIKKGWYVNSAPIITANWNAESGQGWLVPLGVGLGKVFRIGKLPINAQVGYYNYVVKPDNGPDWQLRAQVNFLFPK